MDNLASIFGKDAWNILKEMHLDIVSVDVHTMTCNLVLNGVEYWVCRDGRRAWRAGNDGCMATFLSQWELLAWIGDRL